VADRSRGYDYNHASSGHQFLAIVMILGIGMLAGLAIGLAILGVFL